MSMTDPIADYLTRIRNASMARKSKVDVPASSLIKEVTRILLEEGYIYNYTAIHEDKKEFVRIYLKYNDERKCAITGLRRVSSPGYRRYTKVDTIPRVLNGLGIAVLSTPKGILTDKQARRERVGGEVLCFIW